jgi:hypothetical protein
MSCSGNCKDCNCKENDYVYDESGFIVGTVGITKTNLFNNLGYSNDISYKYAEDKILAELKEYLDKTYTEHYMTENQSIECFDAWIALGDSTPTFRNTALKYLWRYGKKNGNNKKDLMKALHYIMMCLYVDHYKDEK